MKNEMDFNNFNSVAADYGDPPVVDFDPSDLTDAEFINFLKHHSRYKMTKKEIESLPNDICKKIMAQAVIENL
tara:strand:+ start:266 stop:484 length:219 start_codon:yes stop_codon:yes gene_type:complete